MVSKKKSKVAKKKPTKKRPKKPVKKTVKKVVKKVVKKKPAKKRIYHPVAIRCKHYKGDGYSYELNGQKLLICDVCNMFLAGDLFKQMATEVFVHTESFLWKGIENLNNRLEKIENSKEKK